jgi:hypothetical protein
MNRLPSATAAAPEVPEPIHADARWVIFIDMVKDVPFLIIEVHGID